MLFTPEDVSAGDCEAELTGALSGPATGHDRWHVRKDGSRFWGTNTAQPLYDAHGTLLGFTKIVRDLTERFLASEALGESAERFRAFVEKTQHASIHDDLTGLANKSLFREYLVRAIARTERRAEHLFAVLFLDLDRFKVANDTLGHVAADQLLVQVARHLERAIRTEDVVARVGGDEFAILIEDIAGAPEATTVAEHVLTSFQAPFTIGQTELSTSTSIGIAFVSAHRPQPLTADDILADADLAMYEAKARGRSRYVVFHEAMRMRAKATLALGADLREALERREMRVFYQPIVDVRSRRIAGFESVVRWQHAQRGLLGPADYRVTAEETGLIVGIDRWALLKVARQLAVWQNEVDATGHLTICLNLSPKEFEYRGLADELHEILNETALPPHSLAVEITAALPADGFDRIGPVLAELRAIGFDLYVVDFGTGGSSLLNLSRLQATAVKIESSFVNGLGSNSRDVAVVRAMIAFARSLGIRCIAEGVETERQLAVLSELGCDEAQGALFSEPLADEDARALLSSPWRQWPSRAIRG